jgi:4'-phosphopantetheinyl transferase
LSDVDLWVASLDEEHGGLDALPPAERERAESFLRPQVRARWVASRWALRRVLSTYLDRGPAEIEIEVGENGKPRLTGGGPEFNLSHSDELALVAVSPEAPVGVDLERIEPARDLLALAERALGEEDVARIRAVPPAERAEVFYAAWVRHEARLKCLGAGLTGPAPEAPVAVRSLDVGPAYAAAVAVAGESIGQVRRRTLPPS